MINCCFSYADEIAHKRNGTYPEDAAITLRELLKYDMLVFLGYLYDENSAEPMRQVAFANELLQIHLTTTQFLQFRKDNSLDPDLLSKVPDSLKFFVKDDLSPTSRRTTDANVSTSRFIVNSFRDLGLAFIAFAGVSEEESRKITTYINVLNDYLKAYGLYDTIDPLRFGDKGRADYGMPGKFKPAKPRPDATVDMTVAASYFTDDPVPTGGQSGPAPGGRGSAYRTEERGADQRGNGAVTAGRAGANGAKDGRVEAQSGKGNAGSGSSGKQEVEEQIPMEKLLEELDHLIGLAHVKKSLNNLINVIRVRKMREKMGLKQPDMSLHLVFSGNPGTGKTTVARLLAKIYHALGVVSKGQLVEVDRAGLVEGYVGQTAQKTNAVIDSAMGGVLFIDEAYTLTNKKESGDYGQEAVDTLLKRMEDDRKDFIVIVAGYTEPMEEFLQSNPGLRSRFNKFIDFEDYSEEELYRIFISMCHSQDFRLTEEADAYVKEHFRLLEENKDDHFANAREVRNYFERCIERQANRLVKSENFDKDEITTFQKEDLIESLI